MKNLEKLSKKELVKKVKLYEVENKLLFEISELEREQTGTIYKDLFEYIKGNDIKELFFVFDRILKVVLQSDELDFYTDELKDFGFFHSLIRDVMLAEDKEAAA